MPEPPNTTEKASALASHTTDVATVLAEQAKAEATRLAREQSEASVRLAEQRGKESARLESRLDGHDRHLASLNGSIERTAKGLQDVTASVVSLTADFDKHMTVLADRANTHAAAMAKQVAFRTFVLCAIGGITGLVTLMIQHPF